MVRSAEEPTPLPEGLMEVMQQQADLVNAGSIAEAEGLSSELLAQLCHYAGESLADDPELQEELVLQAHAEAGDWEQVQRMHEARLDRRTEPLPYGTACSHLAHFLTLMDRWDEAAPVAALATQAARQDDLPLLLGMRLEAQGAIANGCGEHRLALSLFEEGLRNLEIKSSHDLIRARLLIGRARSHLRLGNLADSEADLSEAWKLLQPLSAMTSAGGVKGAFADWWSVQADRCEREAHWQSVHEARSEAVRCCREVLQLAETQQIYPLYHALIPLARELCQLAQTLARLGQTAAAEEVRDEAQEIRRQVHLPALPE